MKQLTGLDTSFLNMETSTQFGHVNSIVILDPSTMVGDDVYANFKRTIEERLHLLDIYRRKLVADPFGLDNPYWVDDPSLDLEFHIREIGLPAPGNDRQLAEQIARLAARPLDRTRPLWEWYVITGLEGGLVGLFSKLHHATIDGASGVELLHVLLDTDPAGRVVEPPERPWEPEPTPSSGELLARALWNLALKPKRLMEYQARMLKTTVDLTGNPVFREKAVDALRFPALGAGRSSRGPVLPTGSAPSTPFNRAITPHRRFAFRTLRLSDVQTVKRAFGLTVNDVVMALCSTALRTYLADRDALPDESLIAMVPVSVRSGDESDTYSSRVAGVSCSLHTDLADPVQRLMAIHESMAAAKELQRAIPANVLTDMTQFTPPILAAQAARLGSMIKIADRMKPPVNLVISNVPGPREPLYLSGGVVKHYYPVSGVADGLGLNMTVQSYLDNLDFGLISCRELVPDLWDLCDLLPGALDELLASAAPAPAAKARRSTAKAPAERRKPAAKPATRAPKAPKRGATPGAAAKRRSTG
jgi:WS/DGAT/MGAT family acyltransferase